MTHDVFKDKLFDILNETKHLPIADIDTNDKENQFKILLKDGSQFIISTTPCRNLFKIVK